MNRPAGGSFLLPVSGESSDAFACGGHAEGCVLYASRKALLSEAVRFHHALRLMSTSFAFFVFL